MHHPKIAAVCFLMAALLIACSSLEGALQGELIAQASYPPLPDRGVITYTVHDGGGYIGQRNPLSEATLSTKFGYRIDAVGSNIDLNGVAPLKCTTYLRGSVGGKWEKKGQRTDGTCLLPPAPKKFGVGEARVVFRTAYPNAAVHDTKATFYIKKR